jgi:hypothetical protein
MSILDAKGKEKDAVTVSAATITSVSTTTNDITTEEDEENQQRGKVTGREIPLVESPSTASNNIAFNNTATTSSAGVRAQIQPRQTEPGAVRVPGLDGENADDDEISVSNTTESRTSRVDPNNPLPAVLVDEDEENQRIQEKIDREVAAVRERELAEQEGEIPEAEILIEKNHCSTRVKILSGIAMVLLASVAIVLGTVLPRLLEPKETSDTAPTPEDIALLSSVSFDNGTALQTPSTPQNDALIWLANNTNLDSYSEEKKIQRYVLAVLYYSTNGDRWFDNSGWLSNGDECNWYTLAESSFCINGSVVELDFYDGDTSRGNNLVGTIPNELALLSHSLGKFVFGIIDCCVTKG